MAKCRSSGAAAVPTQARRRQPTLCWTKRGASLILFSTRSRASEDTVCGREVSLWAGDAASELDRGAQGPRRRHGAVHAVHGARAGTDGASRLR